MSSLPTGLPAGWEVRHSNSKNLPYYFNPATRESRWEPPDQTNPEQLKVYMAHYHSSSMSQPPPTNAAGSSSTSNIASHQQAAAAAVNGAPGGSATSNGEGKIRAAHLLVKHAQSRRPASWREAHITRSKEEARAILAGHENSVRSGQAKLGDLAVQESDCSSARKRGDLGFFGRGDMQKEFEEAAFALRPGEVSGIVETASGLHLIERLE